MKIEASLGSQASFIQIQKAIQTPKDTDDFRVAGATTTYPFEVFLH